MSRSGINQTEGTALLEGVIFVTILQNDSAAPAAASAAVKGLFCPVQTCRRRLVVMHLLARRRQTGPPLGADSSSAATVRCQEPGRKSFSRACKTDFV